MEQGVGDATIERMNRCFTHILGSRRRSTVDSKEAISKRKKEMKLQATVERRILKKCRRNKAYHFRLFLF